MYVEKWTGLQVTKKLVSLDMEMGRNSLQRGDGETLHGVSTLSRAGYVFTALVTDRYLQQSE